MFDAQPSETVTSRRAHCDNNDNGFRHYRKDCHGTGLMMTRMINSYYYASSARSLGYTIFGQSFVFRIMTTATTPVMTMTTLVRPMK